MIDTLPARVVLLLTAWLGLASDAAGAQVPAESFLYESWTVQDGLPVNAVTRVLQGPAGYLWLATWDGLVRFDGDHFTIFDTGNTDALPSNRIVELAKAADGSLWMRTEQNHLVRWWGGEFTHFGAANGLRDRSTQSIHLDGDGGVWVGTDQGVFRLAGERFIPVAQHAIRGEVETLFRDAAGILWVGTRGQGLYRVRGDQVTHYDTATGLASNWVTKVRQDREGTVWIGTAAGVDRYRHGEIEPVVRDSGRPLEQQVNDLRVAPSTGEVWVVAEKGIYVARGGRLRPVIETPGQVSNPAVRFDPTGTVWYAAGDRLYRDGRVVFRIPFDDPAERRPTLRIEDLAWDHEGSLWIGTQSSGLYRLKPSLFRVYSTAEGVANRNVTVVLEDRAGAVWVGTQGRGLSRVAGDSVTSYTQDQGFPAFISALMQDGQGDLWAGTLRLGILRCRLPAMACGAPPGGQPAPGATVRALHQDAAGDVWAGTDQGLFRLRRGVWERMAPGEELESSPVRVFREAPDGTLWMGTNGGGVLAYRGGRFSRITTADGLPSDLIRSLYLDARGRLWVGTEGRGLARITVAASPTGGVGARAVRLVRQRDGLFDEVIHQMLEDDFGRLWMSTNRGIFWVALSELEAFADGRVPRIHSTAYTERDGLRNREANGGNSPAGIRARDGRLWFATQDGAVVVDPDRIRRNEVPPPVVVEQLDTRERTLPAGAARLALGADERDFEIDYTALSLIAPENVRFRYRLEGLTEEWTDAGNRRTAFYTNVPPGRYTFRVIASNNDGVWNEEGASLELSVAPHFQETRGAYVLLVLTLGLLATGGFQWRLRSLRRRERELTRLVGERTAALRQHEHQLEARNTELAALHEARSRLFTNLSHEFRTPLTLILGPLRSLLDGRHGRLDPSAREQGELMQRSGQRLLRLINQILDLTKLQAGGVALDRRTHDLVGFARAATLAFAPLAERRGIALRFHSELSELPASFDAEQLEKVLLNLLSNALKFTERGGRVTVSVGAEEAAEIVVRDTGVGIAPEELPHVFERFYQADASATRRYEGTGIGLALARELVELHGGEIRAESEPGAGSTFILRLPFGIAPDESLPPVSRVAETAPASPETLATMLSFTDPDAPAPSEDPAEDRTTALVVDDNADVRAYVRSILDTSYRVLEAGDGRAGLEVARAALPDLIVADVMMPELDGLAMAQALKDDPMTDAIPVVLLTARAAAEDQIAGFETGADAYLVKPFDPGVLEALVANLLAQRRRLRERFRQGEAAPPPSTASTPSPLEQRLRPLVEAHLHDPDFGPEALAAAASLSYHQLYRALRDELGTTPSRFIRTVRVECAAALLRQGEGNVTEIAYGVGFESLSYFRRAFRERFGTSPSEHLASSPPG